MVEEQRKYIKIVGAREHNLKNVTVNIPKSSLTVITGPSGSGKSSLAMDVLYAEGQRRYVESLSSYARQFLGVPKKPDVDQIHGLCPAIAIDQKTVGSNPRSTVGTITEIYDYLRVLFARIGSIFCPQCAKPIQSASPQFVAQVVRREYKEEKVTVTAPIAVEKKGTFVGELEQLYQNGYHRFIIDDKVVELKNSENIASLRLQKTQKHSIEVIVDVFNESSVENERLHEALERAFALAQGKCQVRTEARASFYSIESMCGDCSIFFPDVDPRLFAFNAPAGACSACHGLGVMLQGSDDVGVKLCTACGGKRLNKYALAISICGKNIYEVSELSIQEGLDFINKLSLTEDQEALVGLLVQEIKNRYLFLYNVGLSYLSLNRSAKTLSGGEGQRIRLATQIGSALSGVVYVLDEPSIGLHQRDNDRLIATLKALRDQGNTVVVVEHDQDTMMQADHLIDMGPAAGVHGGSVVAEGSPSNFMITPASLTGDFLSGKRTIDRLKPLRVARHFLTLPHAKANNLKNITVQVPLGVLCGVSGVSGSGKSSLVMQELVPAVEKTLMPRHRGGYGGQDNDRLLGAAQLQALVVVDQAPIGRTPRSNPATYLGIFDDIRSLFAGLPDSKMRGYTCGRFSFNVSGGRCQECSGYGSKTVSMHFLPDVTVICTVCKGARYNKQTLEITYKNKNIADVLRMTVDEAREFFSVHRSIRKKLDLLYEVGLGYLELGQDATTLSGGEAQRIKLVDELAKRGTRTLYVLDEPTTGLHAVDIERLLAIFDKLIEKGNSVLVIEHNIDVLKVADYLIDLGPEGGDAGGQLVAQGTPEQVAETSGSFTGFFLKKALTHSR